MTPRSGVPNLPPPRLAQRLIERRFNADAAESLIGDLNEEFADRAARDGAASARRWYWRQALWSMVARRRDAAVPVFSRRILIGMPQDFRMGLRAVRRSPGFAIAAIATLALGIGTATAVGTAASRALLRPLPFPAGERLLVAGDGSNNDGEIGNVGFETTVDWRARMTSLDEVAVIRGWTPTLSGPDGAARLDGLKVTWNYFRALGVRPALGRDFEPAEDTPDNWRVVILSDGLWRRRFGASPDVIGSTISFNERPFRVVGVLPASFEPLISERFANRAELWAPLGYAIGGDSSCRSCRHLKSIARLKPGATIEEARAELAAVQAGLRREHPADYTAEPPRLERLHDVIAGRMARPLQLLMGAVAFVLLVACANVAGLLIARASDRTQEIALRAALGASRGRLVRQLLVEAAALAIPAAVAGFGIAKLELALLASRAPVNIPRLDGASGDPWLFGTAALLSIGSLAVCALIPALSSSHVQVESTLREARQTAPRGALRIREWLMAVEIAAALLVVAGGGLMFRTVERLLHVDPGFKSERILTAGLSLVGPRWAEDRDVRTFQSELMRRLQALPSVESVALAGQIPLGGNYDRRGFQVIGRPAASAADKPDAERYSVTPGYFSMMGIPLKQGRWLTDKDRFEAEKVILIGETTARNVWPGESPIGKQVQFGSVARPRVMTVVGVVGDVRHYSLAATPNDQFYSTQEQFTDSYLILLVRGEHPDQLTAAIRREIAALAPDVPLYDVHMFDSLVSDSIATRTFLMMLLAGLGAITLVLAGIGLYGVVSQSVAVRRRELGIRVALGASRSSVLALLARRGFWVFTGGTLAGLAGAAATGYFIKSQLFETEPVDPLTLAVSVSALALVTAIAHFAPLRRALRTNPTETLRGN